MKHFLKITAILFLCVFTSCNKDDNGDDGDEMSNDELIVGTWTIDSRTVNGTQDQLDECDLQFTVSFSANLDITTVEFFGNNCAESEQAAGTYTLNGTTLVVSQGTESITGEITNLTSNDLSIRFMEDEDVVENYSK
jgi:hypothetical protein